MNMSLPPPVPPSRTPSDINLTPEEEAELVVDHTKEDCRWWLILENGRPADIFAQKEARPDDAQFCGGDWFMPWYNTKSHVHAGDRGDLSWAAHMYGTLESVRKVHAMVLARVGHVVAPSAGWLIYGYGGNHRFFVSGDGVVDYSRGHGGAEAAEKASALGFRIR